MAVEFVDLASRQIMLRGTSDGTEDCKKTTLEELTDLVPLGGCDAPWLMPPLTDRMNSPGSQPSNLTQAGKLNNNNIFWYLFLYMNAKYINHITKWMASRVLNYGHK